MHLCKNLWKQLQLYLSEVVALSVLNPQSAILGFTNVLHGNYLLVNHLLLIIKYNIYNFRNLKFVISQIKYIEETMSKNDLDKIKRNFK